MDAKVKSDWVKALRSGNYAQGDGRLHNPDSDTYCCLGVLCRVVGAEFTAFDGEYDESYITADHVPVLGGEILSAREDEELSQSTLGRFGLTQDIQIKLINMNDHSDKSFSEIADYIESEL